MIQISIRDAQGALLARAAHADEALLRVDRVYQPGDVIVLAGKGHETYQDIGGQKLPFDEKVVVRELLREMGGSPE